MRVACNLDRRPRIRYASDCGFDRIVFSVQTLRRDHAMPTVAAPGSEMPSSQRVFVSAVQKYCADNGIAVETRSQGWLMVMRRGPRRHLAHGYDVGLNSAVTHRIANDKAATAELLEMNGIACVPHAFLPSPALGEYVPAAGTWQAMLGLL